MKSFILIPIFLFPIAATAQFVLTPEGFRNTDDFTTNYLVHEFPEKSQQELFKSAMIYFSTDNYAPKEALSIIEDELITVSGFEERMIEHGPKIFGTRFDLVYSFAVRFKDGKIRMDEPKIKMLGYSSEGKLMELTLNYSNWLENYYAIFKKNGDLNPGIGKEQLEVFFNNIFFKIVNEIENQNFVNEW